MKHFLVMKILQSIENLEHDALHFFLVEFHLLSVNQMEQIVIALIVNEPLHS